MCTVVQPGIIAPDHQKSFLHAPVCFLWTQYGLRCLRTRFWPFDHPFWSFSAQFQDLNAISKGNQSWYHHWPRLDSVQTHLACSILVKTFRKRFSQLLVVCYYSVLLFFIGSIDRNADGLTHERSQIPYYKANLPFCEKPKTNAYLRKSTGQQDFVRALIFQSVCQNKFEK